MRGSWLLRFACVVGVLVLLPGSVAAGGRLVLQDGGMKTGPGHVVVRPMFPRPVARPHFPHPVRPYAAFPPYVGFPLSPYAYARPPAVYYQPSPMVILSPAPPTAVPSVIEYPNGRYELWGDGITTPYRWVWIPKAPPAPPEAPPAAPPAVEPPARLEPTKERPPAPRRDILRWTDEEGVTHWTDQPENIPERYRSKARRPTFAGGQLD
jgi:hypothetical protein